MNTIRKTKKRTRDDKRINIWSVGRSLVNISNLVLAFQPQLIIEDLSGKNLSSIKRYIIKTPRDKDRARLIHDFIIHSGISLFLQGLFLRQAVTNRWKKMPLDWRGKGRDGRLETEL